MARERDWDGLGARLEWPGSEAGKAWECSWDSLGAKLRWSGSETGWPGSAAGLRVRLG